jgi:hypothetical protein
VAHTCNPSFLGDRDQEDHWFKTSLGKQFERLCPEGKVDTSRRGDVAGKGGRRGSTVKKKSVHTYINAKMILVETVP